MWQPKTVERALFKWQKWRMSIISYWAESPQKTGAFLPEQLECRARWGLEDLGFPSSLLLRVYWLSCVDSDYNFDYPISIENIRMPDLLVIPSDLKPTQRFHNIHKIKPLPKLKPRLRIYPPMVITEKDIEFYISQWGYEAWFFKSLLYPQENDDAIFLPPKHEFYSLLNRARGRPRGSIKSGRIPLYSDRLAVACAVLKESGSTYVEIAKQLGLPFSKPYASEQSDIVRHLVKQGAKLVSECLG